MPATLTATVPSPAFRSILNSAPRESFRSNQSLTDRVGDFYGPEFWEDYNIIEPTESLESAVDRLKRRIEE